MDKKPTVYGSNVTQNDTYHANTYVDRFDFEYDQQYKQPVERPKLCVFCNTPWTPRMETVYLESGYCNTCFDSESLVVVVCDSCNRIVYRK